MSNKIYFYARDINRLNRKNQYNPNVGKFQKKQINLAGNSRHKVYENQNYALNKNLIKNGIQSRGVINRNNDDIKLQNIRKFSENHEVLQRQKQIRNLHIDTTGGRKLGEGSFGEVRELKDKNYVVKIPHAKNSYEFSVINKAAKKEFEKAEKAREIINNYIKNYDFGGAQGLDNVAAPVQIIKRQGIHGQANELVMPKVEGKDGDKFIFGDPENGKAPLGIYGKKIVGKKRNIIEFSINPSKKREALSIALQKVMILRALNEAGYANIDTKLENIMISEDGKVSMIDIGSIVKHGTKISYGFTPITASPEIWRNSNAQASSQADVFSDAIDRPYVLFGSIANKYLNRYQKHAELFTSYESATDRDLRAQKRDYLNLGFQEPTFPEDFTNAQKMRYMYYHLGFLKIQKEIGEVYPPKVIDSLAKLQALATEPDPNERLSCKDVEDTLLHLMMSADQWGNGVFRVDGMKVTPWSMPDQILPKNNTEVKKVSPKNNGQKAIKGENIQRPAKVTPNRNRNIVNNKPGNVGPRNIVKNQAKNKNVGAKIGDPKKAKVQPLFNKIFGNQFLDPQKRKQNAPKVFGQKQNVKGNKVLNNALNSGANKLNDTLHQNFGDQLNGTLNQKFRDEISMNQMNDTLNQSFRNQEDGQYQLNDLINDFSESDGVEQAQNINSNKKPAFDKILNESNDQQNEGSHLDDLLEEFSEKNEIERRNNGKDREVKNTRENKSSEATSADSQNSANPTSIRRRYQRNRNQGNNRSS